MCWCTEIKQLFATLNLLAILAYVQYDAPRAIFFFTKLQTFSVDALFEWATFLNYPSCGSNKCYLTWHARWEAAGPLNKNLEGAWTNLLSVTIIADQSDLLNTGRTSWQSSQLAGQKGNMEN